MRKVIVKYVGGPLNGQQDIADFDEMDVAIHKPEGVYTMADIWSKHNVEHIEYKFVPLSEWEKLEPEINSEEDAVPKSRTVWYYLKKLWKGR